MIPFSETVSNIVEDIDLENNYNKEIIKYRFLEEVSYYEKKRDDTKKYFNIFRFTVTTGSILLPAILSMGQMDPEKLPKNFDPYFDPRDSHVSSIKLRFLFFTIFFSSSIFVEFPNT